MSDNGSDRLASLESAVVAMQAALVEVVAAVQRQGETTARGFETLTQMMRDVEERLSERITALDERLSERITALDERLSERMAAIGARIAVLDARFSVLDARMVEVIAELRTHSHKGAA